MKYCRNTTAIHQVAHSHNSCLVNINTLIIAEGYVGVNPVFNNLDIAINLDKAEEIIASSEGGRAKNKSMDMAFGLKNPDASNTEMLMVEFKFNLNEVYNLKKVDLEGKVAGSSLVLSNTPPIHNLFIFIFKTNRIQEAKNRLLRMIPRINSNYVVMDIHQLKATYF